MAVDNDKVFIDMHRLYPPIPTWRPDHEEGVLKILNWKKEAGLGVEVGFIRHGVYLVYVEEVVAIIDTGDSISTGILMLASPGYSYIVFTARTSCFPSTLGHIASKVASFPSTTAIGKGFIGCPKL